MTPNGVDPAFGPEATVRRNWDYVARGRGDPAAEEPARRARRGARGGAPARRRRAGQGRARSRRSFGRRGTLAGYVPVERLAELYRGAACLVQASRHEGFGLPVVEAMASGTPVVVVPDPALAEVAGDAAVIVEEPQLAEGIRRALAESERLAR